MKQKTADQMNRRAICSIQRHQKHTQHMQHSTPLRKQARTDKAQSMHTITQSRATLDVQAGKACAHHAGPSCNQKSARIDGFALWALFAKGVFCQFRSHAVCMHSNCVCSDVWQCQQSVMMHGWPHRQDSLAEWSKALASGASPQGRGLEPHSCQ